MTRNSQVADESRFFKVPVPHSRVNVITYLTILIQACDIIVKFMSVDLQRDYEIVQEPRGHFDG